MTAKRYRLYVNRKPYDYTYDADGGVVRVRLPGMSEHIVTTAANSDDARMDVRQMIERATGQTSKLTPERKEFLSGILCTLAEQGLIFGCGYMVGRGYESEEYTSVTIQYPECEHLHTVDLDSIASALAKVSNALTAELLDKLDISDYWRAKMAHANAVNDAGMVDPPDAANLAEIAVFGQVKYG